MTTPDERNYRLSPEESQRIFREDIRPDLFGGRQPQDRPTAVILLGQPGAGKTRLAEMIARNLDQRGGFADIDTDLYKPYHPAYAELMAKDDRLMTLHIGPEGREWMRQAQDYVRTARINALVQDIANDPATSAQTVRDYRAAGFQVEVVAMAVHKSLSDQGILNRYHEQVRDRGQGRLTQPEKAAAAYVGMVEYAGIIDRERMADAVAVYRRGEAEPRYSNRLSQDGNWTHEARFGQSLTEAREQPLSAAETRDFLRVQDKLTAEMPSEFREQLTAVHRDVASLLHAETVELHDMMGRVSKAFPHSAGKATERPQDLSTRNVHEADRAVPRPAPEQGSER
ncbi:zeta toxin family protein [Streptomyces canus]|uniref:zeta toxin family protein n=1 Tax=Streptomyces canus TaxID=58343 RepID=UPI002E26C72E|nr:zeta toxin family protein [Streptomyces canus]